jgi:hypothetical protein
LVAIDRPDTVVSAAAALTPGVIALPWLATPAAILLAVSQAHPLFTGRYVVFSQPALALLCAAGLSWLADVAARLPPRGLPRPAAWLLAAAIVVLLVVLLAGPQQAIRHPGSRIDNLRRASAVLAAHELPGDAVLYLPSSRRIVSMAYPGPFRRLHDIALGRSPAATATLAGTEVNPAVLRHRFAGVRRVWLVTIRVPQHPPDSHTDQAKITLITQLHLAAGGTPARSCSASTRGVTGYRGAHEQPSRASGAREPSAGPGHRGLNRPRARRPGPRRRSPRRRRPGYGSKLLGEPLASGSS